MISKYLLIALSFVSIPAFFHATAARAADAIPLKVVVQFSDPNPKVIELGLKNVKAMLAEAQAQHTLGEIRVVTLGPALQLFNLHSAAPLPADSIKIFEELRTNEHIHFYACENTMKAFNLKLADLMPGFQGVHSGAYEVIRLQRDGFQYYKP